jgi:hypothetical protein
MHFTVSLSERSLLAKGSMSGATATRIRAKTNLGLKLRKCTPQRSDIVILKTLTDFLLSWLPGYKTLANQRLTLVRYFDEMPRRSSSRSSRSPALAHIRSKCV